MSLPSDFAVEVESARLAQGLAVNAVAKLAGISTSTLQSYLRATNPSSPSIEKAHRICTALGLDFYVGPRRGRRHSQAAHRAPERVEADLTSAAVSVWPVDVHDLMSGASPTGCMWMTASWMQRWGLAEGNLVAIRLQDDAIEPALPRATVIVDRTRRDLRSGALYGFEPRQGQQPFVRRCICQDGAWHVRRGFPGVDEPWPQGAEIIGAVVWASAQFQVEPAAP